MPYAKYICVSGAPAVEPICSVRQEGLANTEYAVPALIRLGLD